MASDLKWRTGFDWGSVCILAAGSGAAVFGTGAVRWFGAVTSTLALAFMAAQFRKWNRHGWPQVHFRGMLAYSAIAGKESARSTLEGRTFDRLRACEELGRMMCGPSKSANVSAMIQELSEEHGDYLARILETTSAELHPETTTDQRQALAAKLAAVDMGPVLVIANVIENTYGPREAGKYTLALLEGKAH